MRSHRCLLFAAACLLGVCSAGEGQPPDKSSQASSGKQARTDQYGDPLPEGALTRFGTVRFRYGGWVQAVTFSNDGKTILSAGAMRVQEGICAWDPSTGTEQRRLKLPREPGFS